MDTEPIPMSDYPYVELAAGLLFGDLKMATPWHPGHGGSVVPGPVGG
jgi:hypothetical protein